MPQKKIIQPNIQINWSNIEFVEKFVFLGITINNKLNWNSHIIKVTNIPIINHAFEQLNIRHSVVQTVSICQTMQLIKYAHTTETDSALTSKTTSFLLMKLHVKSRIVMYVNSRPSPHTRLFYLFIYLLH